MTRQTRLLNRALPEAMPADGWFHLAPFGRFPARFDPPEGESYRAIQIADRAAFDAILENFAQNKARADFRGLLLDEDHLSDDPHGRTAAMGRVLDLQVRGDGQRDGDGLWCRIEFTPPGADAVRNKVYSFLSLDADVSAAGTDPETRLPMGRLAKLHAVALTNKPRLPVRALNRDLQDTPRGAPGKENDPANAGKKGQTMDFKAMLLKLLGLGESATDQEIQAAVDGSTGEETMSALKTKNSALEAENRTLKQAALEKEADAFCENHKAKIKNRDTVRAEFLKNPVAVRVAFENAVEPTQPTLRTLNGGKTPDERTKTKNRRAEQDAAVRAHMTSTGMKDYGKAQQQVAASKPELFA